MAGAVETTISELSEGVVVDIIAEDDATNEDQNMVETAEEEEETISDNVSESSEAETTTMWEQKAKPRSPVPCVEVQVVKSQRNRPMFVVKGYLFERTRSMDDREKDESIVYTRCIRSKGKRCKAHVVIYRKGTHYFARMDTFESTHSHEPDAEEIIKRQVYFEKRLARKPKKKRSLKPKVPHFYESVTSPGGSMPTIVQITPMTRKQEPTSRKMVQSPDPSRDMPNLSLSEVTVPSHVSIPTGEFEAVGRNIVTKLEKMSPKQQIYAEALLAKVISKGLLEKLTDATDVVDVYNCQNYFSGNFVTTPGSAVQVQLPGEESVVAQEYEIK